MYNSRKMLFQSVGIALMFTFNLVSGHLKNLGETSINVSSVHSVMEARIAGGHPAHLDKFPFNAQFFNKGGFCSAIIISTKTVLTAAHCFDLNKNIGEMRLWAAARYMFDRSSQQHEVWDFRIHPHYNEKVVFSNDIAAVIIRGALVFGRYANMAKLSNSQEWMTEDQKMFIATGWGETAHSGELSDKGLLQANLRYVTNEHCREQNGGMELSPDMFCLYGDGVRDTCQGDSGGGILWNDMVVGIVSHGDGCAKAPGIYVNVYYFKHWIHEVTQELLRKYCHFRSVG